MLAKICSVFIAPLLFIGCSALPLKPISSEDLPDLKGKWEGVRDTTGAGNYTNLSTTLEIKNDSSPIQASIYFHQTASGTIEYRVIYDVVDGKLWSRTFNHSLTLYRDGNRLQLKGPMDLPGPSGNYHEEFTFRKNK